MPAVARRRPVRGAVVPAVLIVAAVAGCSSAAGRGDGPPAVDRLIPVSAPSVSVPPAPPTPGTGPDLVLPTETYRPTAAQRNLIADAVQLRIAECMHGFGLTWTVRAVHVPDSNRVDRLYGVSDPATAQRYGYHLPPADARTAGEPLPGASLSPSERLVLSGSATGESTDGLPGRYRGRPIPDGGCTAQARRETIGADDIDPTHVADAITVGMWEKSRTDPRVAAVIEAWAQCMRQEGYRYPSPLDAGNDHPAWLRSAAPGPEEIRTAVADVACKQRTNLVGTWFAVESGYELEAIRLHQEQLDAIRRQWQEAAARAARVVDPDHGQAAP
ncbi:hypothetical protein [Dactylosporangium sp. CA-092794]|uniref:hypothetical protein n=1 Tax=Dactylosporangium sp. CA-092794 TaxID=3239929 RepID=UPI003D8D3472